MNSWYSLNLISQAALLMWQFLVLCFGVCFFLISFKKSRILQLSISLLCAFVSGFFLVVYSSNVRSEKKGNPLPEITKWLSEIDVKPIVLIMSLITVYLIYDLWKSVKYYKQKSVRTRIRESVDMLPAGLCFFYENGRCILVNYRMNELCRELYGVRLQNAVEFWEMLKNGEPINQAKRLERGENPIFRLSDNSVWSFMREKVGNVCQLSAVEITQVQIINEKLALESLRLDEVNKRLRDYGENIDEHIRAKERLELKANIHRELGKALLVNRKYILSSSPSNPPFNAWENIVSMLNSQTVIPETDTLSMFLRSAKQAGVEIKIKGEFPENTEIKNFFIIAAVESLVNAVRHAEATELEIELSQSGAFYNVRFTNNGKIPCGEIVEGGGISALRKKAAQFGGEVKIKTKPRFALEIFVICERSEDLCIKCCL